MFNIPLIPPTVPQGFCDTLTGADWVQQLANMIVGKGVAQLDGTGFTPILNSEAVPGVNDIDKLWFRPSTAGLGLYRFSGGTWIIPHPSPAGGNERRHWVGTLTQLQSFDGGDGTANPPQTNVGAMWEEDIEFRGRSSIGPGAVPLSSPAVSTTVAVNAGAGSVLQTDQMVGTHDHPLLSDALIQDGRGVNVVTTGVGGAGLAVGLTAPPLADLLVGDNTYTTTQVETPILHPVRGMYVIKRSARVNYTGV